MKKIAVVSLSGGMDSTGLLVHLLAKNYDVYGVSFYYGQKHSLELERLQQNLSYMRGKGFDIKHTLIDLSSVMGTFQSSLTSKDIEVPEGFYAEENMKSTVVPNRNAIFSSVVYGYALSLKLKTGADEVVVSLGVHTGDHTIYPDCKPEFYQHLYKAFQVGNWDGDSVKLYLPYMEGDKTTILQDALVSCEKLGLDFDTVFANTNTSYNPTADGKANGYTGSDVERILAFVAIGRKDPVQYVDAWEVVRDNAVRLEKEHTPA